MPSVAQSNQSNGNADHGPGPLEVLRLQESVGNHEEQQKIENDANNGMSIGDWLFIRRERITHNIN